MSAKRKDITGQKWNRLTAIRPAEYNNRIQIWHWHFRCDCGQEKILRPDHVRRGTTKSCGCLRKERNFQNIWKRREEARQNSAFITWEKMIAKCEDKNHPDYPFCGERGITVCERWKDFQSFLEDMGEHPNDYELFRIDLEAGFTRDNCRWKKCPDFEF